MAVEPRLSFGIKTTPVGVTYDEILRVWLEADAVPQIEHAWLWDHLQPLRGDLAAPVLDGWTLLAALAGQTRSLQLGLLVTNNLVRPPAVLAKIAATTDVISRGRLVLGLGAGGSLGPESRAYGLPEPTVGERIERLAEAATIVRRLWSEPAPVDFDGRHYQLAGTRCEPRPVQVPGPPILIGGVGEQQLLRVVAEHADIWNMPGPPHLSVGDFVAKSRVLDEHCQAIDRDPAEITRSVQLNADVARPEVTRDQVVELVAAGAGHIVLSLTGPYRSGIVAELVDKIIHPVADRRAAVGAPPAEAE